MDATKAPAEGVDQAVTEQVTTNDRKDRQTHRSSQQIIVSSLASALGTLVDQPGGTDFLSLALNSGAFSKEEKDNQVTFSTSLYAIGSFFNPEFVSSFEKYQNHAHLRRFSVSVTTGKTDDSSAATANNQLNITSFLAKYQIGTRDVRDSKFNSKYVAIQKKVSTFTRAYNRFVLNSKVLDLMQGLHADTSTLDDTRIELLKNRILSDPELMKAYEDLERDLVEETKRSLQDDLDAIAEEAKKRWIGSIAFGGKFVENQLDRYSVEGNLKGKPWGVVDFNLSGDMSWTTKPTTGNREIRGKVGLELLREFKNISLSKEKLGSSLSFSFNYERRDLPHIVRAQTKWEFLLSKGVSLPFSVTWANRTEFVNEREVRGNFGISYDFSALLKALK